MNFVPMILAVAAVAVLAAFAGGRFRRAPRPPAWVPPTPADYATLLAAARGEFARRVRGKIDWSRNPDPATVRHVLRRIAEAVVADGYPVLNRIESAKLVDEIVAGVRTLE